MKIIITGATGFVGLSLVQLLHDQGHDLIALVRNQVDVFPALVRQVIRGDLVGGGSFSAELEGVDVVIHLAARAHVMHDTSSDPLAKFREINTVFTLDFARQAAEAGVARFIYMSSIKVNGETCIDSPFTADSKCCPSDPYGMSKYEAERGLMDLSQKVTMDVVVLRPPLVYGPGVKGNFPQLMNWVRKGVPLPLGSIFNRRSLVAVGNLVDLVSVCIEHPAASNQIFLVSDDNDFSTTELVRSISDAQGGSMYLIPVPQWILEKVLKLIGKEDVMQRLCGDLYVDIAKTKNVLTWEPPVKRDDAIKQTVQAWQNSDR